MNADIIIPAPAADGYFHPRSEAEVQALVRWARANHRSLRVRGSGHSVAAAIFARPETAACTLVLDRMDAVTFDEASMQVTAEGGAHLGLDPRDPTGRSTIEGSINAIVASHGAAFPDLGGISHQTIAGFLATGSAGGSLRHNFSACVVSMRMVDGRGDVRVFDASDPDTLAGALVSLGLLGVVTAVTLQCEPSYDIVGHESVQALADGEVDLFSDGTDGIAATFRRAEYMRVLWWPQPGVERVVCWQARRMHAAEYDAETGPRGALVRLPYRPFPPILGSDLPMQAAAGLALRAIGSWPARLQGVMRTLAEQALKPVYQAFVPTDADAPQRFRDTWWQGLPMDDVMDDRFMPVRFLEAWIPLDAAAAALTRIRDGIARDGYRSSGTFVIELYPGAPSAAWLSPGHGAGESLRINVFCLEHAQDEVRETFFASVLAALGDLDVRLHWGKQLHADARDTRLVERFPRGADFLALRRACDPDEVFLTDYWRAHLGLADAAGASFPHPEHTTARFPLVFRLLPVGADFRHTASGHFHNRATMSLAPAEVFDIFAHDLDAEHWFTDLHDIGKPSGRLDGVGEVADLNYDYMTVRVRYTAYEPGRRLCATVDAWSLPLCERMAYEVRLSPLADGGTGFEWDVWYDPMPAFKKLAPLVRPVFARLFRNTTRDLARYTRTR